MAVSIVTIRAEDDNKTISHGILKENEKSVGKNTLKDWQFVIAPPAKAQSEAGEVN